MYSCFCFPSPLLTVSHAQCNWDAPQCPTYRQSDNSVNMTACGESCLAVTDMCAVCEPSSPFSCRRVTALLNSSLPAPAPPTCPPFACVTEGNLVGVSEQSACATVGTCSVPCFDSVCVERGGAVEGQCIILAANASVCAGVFYADSSQCVLRDASTSTDCANVADAVWVPNACASMSLAECGTSMGWWHAGGTLRKPGSLHLIFH